MREPNTTVVFTIFNLEPLCERHVSMLRAHGRANNDETHSEVGAWNTVLIACETNPSFLSSTILST